MIRIGAPGPPRLDLYGSRRRPTLDACVRIQSHRFAQLEKITAISRHLRGSDHLNALIYYPPDKPGSADQCLAYDPAGHEGFTRQLVAAALRRHRG